MRPPPDSTGRGPRGPAEPRLVVVADLDVAVVSPTGRRGAVRLADRDGVLVVQLTGLRALAASLPRALPVVGPDPGHRREMLSVLGRTWRQPVDVLVGGRTVVRRRHGRWRPTAASVRPVLAAVAAVAGAVAALLVLRRKASARR